MTPRHARQARLAEVGAEGQGRIARASAHVRGTGVAARVEARYLAGAGVEDFVVDEEGVRRSALEVDGRAAVRLASESAGGSAPGLEPDWAAALHPSAREVALGAHGALRTLRDAVLTKGR